MTPTITSTQIVTIADSAGAAVTVNTRYSHALRLLFTSVSSFVGTITATAPTDTTGRNISFRDVATGKWYGPGDQYTPSAGDMIDLEVYGFASVTITRVSGSCSAVASLGVVAPYRRPTEIQSSGVLELVGINERVDQYEYSQEVEQAFSRTISGEILNVTLISTEDGSGAVLRPEGTLFGLNADPNVSVGATTLGAANFPKVVAQVEIDSSLWSTNDTGGAVASKAVAFAFESVSSLFWVFQLKSATSINDAAGDDEQLELVVRYREEAQ